MKEEWKTQCPNPVCRCVLTAPYPVRNFECPACKGTFRIVAIDPDHFQCMDCEEPNHDDYMVDDDVWLAAVPDGKGKLHAKCLEMRLGRELTLTDFTHTWNLPANAPFRLGYKVALR